MLNATADANTSNWTSVSNNTSITTRGGGTSSSPSFLQISDRSTGQLDFSAGSPVYGGRGVRTGE